eukprot:TRINITY_DN2759_c0_g1_i7.p1 TRINITY_DN2759_c0_g1~~TRINITY_DN2759_c0_g1_i7.p1  ORF type:complete len:280 (-),score=19.45 TRINITY_DN2759_c0_g1_i7:234-1073(-)
MLCARAPLQYSRNSSAFYRMYEASILTAIFNKSLDAGNIDLARDILSNYPDLPLDLALTHAVRSKSADTVRFILQQEIPPSAYIHKTCGELGTSDILDLLVEHGFTENMELGLSRSVLIGNTDAFLGNVKRGVHPRVCQIACISSPIVAGNLEICKVLLPHFKDVPIPQNRPRFYACPLYYIAVTRLSIGRSISAAEILLDAGADVNLDSPLDNLFTSKGDPVLAGYLIERGAILTVSGTSLNQICKEYLGDEEGTDEELREKLIRFCKQRYQDFAAKK